jgi:HPt (histidine-containing phosphotransfer) domain-containing protein
MIVRPFYPMASRLAPYEGDRSMKMATETSSGKEGPKTVGTVDTEAWDHIRALQRPGQPDLLGKVLGLFVQNSRELVDTLRHAVEQQDAQTVFRTAHTLKSSCANVGAAGLAEQCKTLEALGRQNQLARASDVFEQIEAEYAAVLAIVNDELKKRTGA